MYHIYHTEGIILASTATGESDRFFQILTPDLGLIPAVARGSRALASKLRYHLVDYAHIDLDLVRGKEVWTITGVLPREEHAVVSDIRLSMITLSSFVRRLVHGQEPSHELFGTICTAKSFLEEALSEQEREHIILAARAHILATLGYASDMPILRGVGERPFDRDAVESMRKAPVGIFKEIDTILLQTQL